MCVADLHVQDVATVLFELQVTLAQTLTNEPAPLTALSADNNGRTSVSLNHFTFEGARNLQISVAQNMCACCYFYSGRQYCEFRHVLGRTNVGRTRRTWFFVKVYRSGKSSNDENLGKRVPFLTLSAHRTYPMQRDPLGPGRVMQMIRMIESRRCSSSLYFPLFVESVKVRRERNVHTIGYRLKQNHTPCCVY